MTIKPLFPSVLLVAALFVGCKPSANEPATSSANPGTKPASTATDVPQAPDTADYAYERRAEFVAQMRAKAADLEKEIAVIAARIERSGDRAKTELEPKLKALRARVAELNREIEAAQDATPTTWDSIKADVRRSYASVEEGFADARKWLSEKIAP